MKLVIKKTILTFFTLAFSMIVFAQHYELEKLKIISTIWGETYLFHPSIIRADKNVEWEKQFIDFLPKIKKSLTNDEFIQIVNTELLSELNDPFTVVQNNEKNFLKTDNFESTNTFDYIRITENQLSDIGSLKYLDSLVIDRNSNKALVIDLRINNELLLDRHSNTLFEYFASMLIIDEVALSSSVMREHFGWDEYNDWWFYEQRWKVATEDKQISNSGKLMPLKAYSQELQRYLSNYKFNSFVPIERPIYFITNNSFRSYYNSVLITLQTNRANTFIINEDTGKIFPSNSKLKKYSLDNFEFILNTAFNLNHGITDIKYGLNSASLNLTQIINFINSKPSDNITHKDFSFNISPKKYNCPADTLSQEEKILGVIKIWTIVKYFYAYSYQFYDDWEISLEKYLQLSQNTSSDKEYYTLIQEMMATLNDSHVSTFHPSIFDFSELFIAPIKFEWIEEKVIITAIDTTAKIDVAIGDEIVSINGLLINEILENEKKKVSSSNNQGLIATVINPGNFTGTSGSLMKLGIRKNKKIINIETPKTTYIFQFTGYGDNREESKLFEDNIGYLNLAFLTNSTELESELLKMENTKALILDLRSSYPTDNFNQFLRMLCTKRNTKLRIDEVPIISANNHHSKQIQVNEYIINPDTSFYYNNPIAVLIDKTMISRPEDIAISLKSFPNVTFIGEQTQGTDGERTKIYLPGGGETSFTGQIVKFGNGENFQSIGIIPDIKVQRTIDGVKKNKDEILEKAIEVLNKN